jgi:hypothetical protein
MLSQKQDFQGWTPEIIFETYYNYAYAFASRKQAQYPIITDDEINTIIYESLWRIAKSINTTENNISYRIKSSVAARVRGLAKRKSKDEYRRS